MGNILLVLDINHAFSHLKKVEKNINIVSRKLVTRKTKTDTGVPLQLTKYLRQKNGAIALPVAQSMRTAPSKNYILGVPSLPTIIFMNNQNIFLINSVHFWLNLANISHAFAYFLFMLKLA